MKNIEIDGVKYERKRAIRSNLRGGVCIRKTSRGTVYAVRIWAYGRRWYVTLGLEADGWTKTRAEQYAADIADDIRAERWKPPLSLKERPSRAVPRAPKGDAHTAYSLVRRAAGSIDAARPMMESHVARRAANEALSALYVAEDALKRVLGSAT